MPGTTPTPYQIPVLWPFEPDMNEPITESVEYVTNVITSHNDTEDRIALRRRPKIRMKWRVTAMDLAEAGRAVGLLWKMGNRWYVPLWQHARRISALNNLTKIYTVDMTDHRYDFTGKVLLWKSSSQNEIYDLVENLVDGVILANSDTTDQLSYTDLTVAPFAGNLAVLNQPGLDGTPNKATTLTDADSVAFQNRSATWTIPNNNSLHAVHIWVRKDTTTNRFPQIRIALTGGTVAQQTGVILNTSTGAFSTRNTVGGGAISVRDMGSDWLVSLSVTNNTSGHTTLNLAIYPATAATFGGADDATNTGSIVVSKVTTTLNPHTQSFTPDLGTYAIPLGIGTLSQSYGVERSNIVFGSSVEFELDTTSASVAVSNSPNLLRWSESFDNAVWTKGGGGAVTADAGLAPDGTMTADKVTTNGTGSAYVSQAPVATVVGQSYGRAIMVRADTTGTAIFEYHGSSWSGGGTLIFDVINRIVGGALATANDKIIDVGGGWYMCIAAPRTALTTTSPHTIFVNTYGTAPSGRSLYFWGGMMKVGTINGPLDYAKTTTAALPAVTAQSPEPLPPTQTFRLIEVLNIHPDTDDASDTEKWTLTSERVGSDIGPFQVRLFATSPVLERQAQWTLVGRAEFARFRKWLAARRGRRTPLWVPTYQNDLTLVADAALNAGSIDIAAVDFANKFMGSTTRVKIAVLQNGIVYPLVVTAVTTPSTGVERLFLETSLTAAVSINSKVCFLTYARLSEDRVSIDYINNEVALVQAAFTELPRETPA